MRFISFGLLAVLLNVPAIAADLESVRRFDIKPQRLETALLEFSKQAEMQVIGGTETLGDIHTKGVSGNLKSREALAALLEDTAVAFNEIGEHSVQIVPVGKTISQSASGSSPVRLAKGIDGVPPRPSSDTEGSNQENRQSPASTVGDTLEEIVVTAQKRKERLQDVPISMSVLRGEDLDMAPVQGTAEILNRVPGVASMVAVLGTPKLAIRGVSASDPFRGGSTPIAYYIDSVPFGFVKSSFVPDSNVFDLARIEILRGPQGTLYGASAQNGLVRILTHEPDLEEFEFKGRASVSSTDGGAENYRGDAAFNAPLVAGKLAARAVLGYQDLSGWVDKPGDRNANDAELGSVRLKIKAQPTDQLTLGASAWLLRSDFGAQAIADDNAQSRGGAEPVENDLDFYSFDIGYQFAGALLSSRTGVIDYSSISFLDLTILGLTGVAQRSTLESEVLSQELILNSTHGRAWRWTIGGMYREVEDRREHIRVPFNPAVIPTDMDDSSESFAVFSELTRLFLDGRFELTGGLRYFEDDVSSEENISFRSPPQSLITTNGTFEELTPRVVLSWHPNGQSTVYASYAEGFRSGFTQEPRVLALFPTLARLVEADTLKNYELGAKGSLLGGRFGFDTAVYYMDWQDVQQLLGVIAPDNTTQSLGVNGGSASGIGFEFALTTSPVEGLDLGLNFGWNDLTMDQDVVSGISIFIPEGDRPIQSPEYTAGAAVDYGLPLGGNGLRGKFSISGNYTSELTQRALAGPTLRVLEGDPMLIVRASFSVGSRSGWTATLFSENLGDEDGAPLVNPSFRDWDARIRPRTTGVQFDFRF
jgi:iron complex outermembrane recepter protein